MRADKWTPVRGVGVVTWQRLYTYIHTYILTYLHYITLFYITLHYIHTNTYVHIHTFIHTYVHTYIHTYIHAHTYIMHRYICVCVYACMHVCMYVYVDMIHVMPGYIHPYIYICMAFESPSMAWISLFEGSEARCSWMEQSDKVLGYVRGPCSESVWFGYCPHTVTVHDKVTLKRFIYLEAPYISILKTAISITQLMLSGGSTQCMIVIS